MHHTSNESPCQELFNDMIGFGTVYPTQKLFFEEKKNKIRYAYFRGFQPKMKKMNMDSERKLKVCFIKVCSDVAKMA